VRNLARTNFLEAGSTRETKGGEERRNARNSVKCRWRARCHTSLRSSHLPHANRCLRRPYAYDIWDMNTDAQGAGRLGRPSLANHTKNTAAQPALAFARETRRMAHARLAWLVGHCFALRLLFRSVLASLVRIFFIARGSVSLGWALRLAARSSSRVQEGSRSWLLLLVLLGSRCSSVGPLKVRQLAAVSGFSRVLIAVRLGWQRRDAAAAAEEQLGRCTAGQSKILPALNVQWQGNPRCDVPSVDLSALSTRSLIGNALGHTGFRDLALFRPVNKPLHQRLSKLDTAKPSAAIIAGRAASTTRASFNAVARFYTSAAPPEPTSLVVSCTPPAPWSVPPHATAISSRESPNIILSSKFMIVLSSEHYKPYTGK